MHNGYACSKEEHKTTKKQKHLIRELLGLHSSINYDKPFSSSHLSGQSSLSWSLSPRMLETSKSEIKELSSKGKLWSIILLLSFSRSPTPFRSIVFLSSLYGALAILDGLLWKQTNLWEVFLSCGMTLLSLSWISLKVNTPFPFLLLLLMDTVFGW